MKRTKSLRVLAVCAGVLLAACSDERVPLDPNLAPPNRIDVAFANLPGGTPTVCMEQVMENIPGSPDFANCTANDLNLFFTIPGQGQDVPLCLPGDPLPPIVVEAHFGSGAANRWDIGLWIRSDGSGVPDALRGDCRHWSLTPVGATGDLTAPGGIRTAPFYNQDGDSCGDLNQNFETVLTGVTLTGLTCQDSDGDGQLDVGACVGYDNNGNNANSCDDPATAVLSTSPNTPAKCSCGPLDIPINIGGKIIIEKQTIPDGDTETEFQFTSQTTGLSGALKDGESYEAVLTAGTYSVLEAVPAGWDLTSIVCTDPTSNSTGNVGTGTASIDLAAGETVTCVFTNTRQGSITIIKDAVPNDAQDFDFTSTSNQTTTIGSFSLDDDADATLPATRTFTGLQPGNYSVTETAVAGWDLTGLVCGAGGTPNLATATAAIVLPAGGSVTCTFTNTKRGSITIVKDAVPNDAQDFDFTSTSNKSTTIGTFSLDDDADATLPSSRTFTNLEPGNYSVTETAVAGWDLTNLVCGAGGTPNLGTATAAIVLPAGGSVTCTFTNTKRAEVTLNKRESGAIPLTIAFQFQIRVGASVTESGTVVATGSANTTTGVVAFSCSPNPNQYCVNVGGVAKLLPGAYAVCEVSMLPGWANNITGYTPDSEIPEGSDNGNECIDVTLAAGQTGTPSPVPDPVDNTPPPGGDARTIGYWKNHSCMAPGKQDDVLSDNLPISITTSGALSNITDCGTVVYLLDKRDLSNQHRKRASDAAYNLAAQLAAALLNVNAGAGTCPAATTAITQAQALLTSIGFNGLGEHLRPKDAAYNQANQLAAILDAYNNNTLCPAGP